MVKRRTEKELTYSPGFNALMNGRMYGKGIKLSFGKYAGKLLSSVPDSYLLWCLGNFEKMSQHYIVIRSEANRRGLEFAR